MLLLIPTPLLIKVVNDPTPGGLKRMDWSKVNGTDQNVCTIIFLSIHA